ncbi:hypothetical protein [Chryseobacterium lathyri]|uniref:Uncharacterized protein n=1 Tax=Chryseobacterium lathyri TaxID=395933 RepID=A0A511YG14_9FLAO|nr:hypothetical protein [Chryseobacterium lathyri]GEN74121.1 hypothetical protein CLA01_41930 [Chryseobacterium lathyri]
MKEQANITIPTKIKHTVYRKIREDYDLRLKIAADTGKRESAIYLNAYRDSEKIENIFIIQSFQRHTGWTDGEIYEKDVQEIIDAI